MGEGMRTVEANGPRCVNDVTGGGICMALDNAARKRELLDRLVREKDIAASFFTRVADQLEDVDRRRWFRRMGQDEKDQRKILVKHRREVCGANPTPQKVEVSRVHALADRYARSGSQAVRYADALRLAARVKREPLHLRALLGQPAHQGEQARLGDVELLIAAVVSG